MYLVIVVWHECFAQHIFPVNSEQFVIQCSVQNLSYRFVSNRKHSCGSSCCSTTLFTMTCARINVVRHQEIVAFPACRHCEERRLEHFYVPNKCYPGNANETIPYER